MLQIKSFSLSPQVLYVSLHRFDNGRFFPGSPDGNYVRVGQRRGKGFNVNIPWNQASPRRIPRGKS